MSGGKNTYKNRSKQAKHKNIKSVRFLLEKNIKRTKNKNTKRKHKKNTYKKRTFLNK